MLDPRFKNKSFIEPSINDVVIKKTIDLNKNSDDSQSQSQDSQSQIPCTQDQDLEYLSKFCVPLPDKSKKYVDQFFDYDYEGAEPIDADTESLEDRVKLEMQNYLACRLPKFGKGQKVKFNPIAWWKANQNTYPLLSKAVRYYLNIPASSAPSERIFSLASNTVTKKRATLLPDNVNMLIFLHHNYSYIPENTTIYIPTTRTDSSSVSHVEST